MFSIFTFSVLIQSQPANSSQDPILKLTIQKSKKLLECLKVQSLSKPQYHKKNLTWIKCVSVYCCTRLTDWMLIPKGLGFKCHTTALLYQFKWYFSTFYWLIKSFYHELWILPAALFTLSSFLGPFVPLCSLDIYLFY
jgi:hypothetical protein